MCFATENGKPIDSYYSLEYLVRGTHAPLHDVVAQFFRVTDQSPITVVPLGLPAAELHGNLTQRQRAEAVTQFKKGDVNLLVVCT